MFKNWTLFEKIWLCVFTLIGVGTYCYDSGFSFQILFDITFIAMITGILCVVLTAKGSIWSFLFGYINVILYGYIAWKNCLFGECGLNILFFLPINVIGNILWLKHIDNNGNVDMRKLKMKYTIMIGIGSLIGFLTLGYCLSLIETQNTPYLDALTNVLSIVAALLLTWRYREQWLCWIILDIATVVMWFLRAVAGSPEAPLMFVMWTAYLVNAFYGWYVWNKNSQKTA